MNLFPTAQREVIIKKPFQRERARERELAVSDMPPIHLPDLCVCVCVGVCVCVCVRVHVHVLTRVPV